MADLLLNRRYCRFNDRKKRRSKMNGDDAVSFKVKRFIQDIDKYLEKTKKRREQKEIKEKENNSSDKKGFYKNAVLSDARKKALFSGSIGARVKGDLIDLSIKNKSAHKNYINEKIPNLEEGSRDPCSIPKTVEEKNTINNKSSNLLPITKNETNNDIGELETLPVENNNSEQVIEDIRAENENIPCKRGDYVLLHKLNNGGFFSEEDQNAFNDISANDGLQIISQNENCKQILEEEPTTNMMGEFFDLLCKTPEKHHRSSFHLFNNAVDSAKFEQNFTIPSPNIKPTQKSHKEQTITLPEDYIFQFHPEQNHQFDVFKETYNEGNFTEKKTINLSPVSFHLNISSPKCKQSFHDNCFPTDYLRPKKMSGNKVDHCFEEICSIPKYRTKFDLPDINHRENYSFFNFNEKLKSFSPINRRIKNYKKKNEKLKFMDPKVNKNIEKILKDQHSERHRMKYKNLELFKQNQRSLLCFNKRFKTNLKFSPHKYC